MRDSKRIGYADESEVRGAHTYGSKGRNSDHILIHLLSFLHVLSILRYYSLRGVLGYSTFEEAASSTNQYTWPGVMGRTLDAGRPCSGWSRTVLRVSALFAPLATNATRTAWLMTGNVSVVRRGGGLGESVMYATQRSSSERRACPGKSDAVCPSGPTPSRMRSKMGKRAESLFANSRMRSFSYASAMSSSASSTSPSADAAGISVGSSVWMFSFGMGTLDQRFSSQRPWLESS